MMTGGTMKQTQVDRVQAARAILERQRERVAALIQQDRDAAAAENRRRMAEAQLKNGDPTNIKDTVIAPTQELLRKGEFIAYTPRGEDNTVRTVRTVRRIATDTLKTLYQRGVLDDDLYHACRWYRDRYEAGQIEGHVSISSYGDSVRGDPLYGHLPRTQWAAEARADYRFAQRSITPMVLALFDLVCLHGYTLKRAASVARCRQAKAVAWFQKGALDLHGAVASRLRIEPGAPDFP